MEKALRKLANQLNVYDEASLTTLWDKLAEDIENFEPTKEWEEAVLMLGMVQALRWKNQLFNYNWSETLKLKSVVRKKGQESPWPEFNFEKTDKSKEGLESEPGKDVTTRKKRCKVLSFGAIKDDNSV